jgi:hypothetical protein
MLTTKRCLLLAFLCVVWGPRLAVAQPSAPPETVDALRSQHVTLVDLGDRLNGRFARAIEERLEITRRGARELAVRIRETGFLDFNDRDEYARLMGDLELGQRLLQLDFSLVQQAYTLVERRVRALDSISRLPRTDVRQQLGIAGELERQGLLESLDAVFLQAMAAPTPAEGRAIIQDYAQIINTLSDLDVGQLAIEEDRLRQQEEYFRDTLVPLLGESLALVEFVNGQTAMGERLTWVGAAIALLAVVPGVGDMRALAKLPTGVLDQLQDTVRRLSLIDRAAIARTYPGVLPRLDDFARLWRAPVVDRSAAQAAFTADLTTLGSVAQRSDAFNAGVQQGEGLVRQFQDALEGGGADSAVRRLVEQIQSDKHAMHALNRADDRVIDAFNRQMGEFYEAADFTTKAALTERYLESFAAAQFPNRPLTSLSPPQLAALRGELGERLEIVFVTNPRPPGARASAGFDRDVVARVRLDDGSYLDVPAQVLHDAYAPAFYQAVKGTPPPSAAASDDFMHAMDQVAVDARGSEAFGAGPNHLAIAIDPGLRTVAMPDPEQFGLVIAFKANHFFSEARAATNAARREGLFQEGFRQLKKSFDRQMELRRQAFNEVLQNIGASPIRVPSDVEAIGQLLDRSVSGNPQQFLTPARVTEELAALGYTAESAAQRLGSYIADMHTYYADATRRSSGITSTLDNASTRQLLISPDGPPGMWRGVEP